MGRAIILMYHIVDTPRSEAEARYAITPERFSEHMGLIHNQNMPVIALGALPDWLAKHHDQTALVITLDDGTEDAYSQAFRILTEHGFPASFFVLPGLMGGENGWMQAEGFPARKMLSWEQAREMAAGGMDMGCHSMSHAKMATLSGADLLRETVEARDILEQQLGESVKHFAYPYGNFSDAVCDAVRNAGFAQGLSVRAGFNERDVNPFILRRVEVYGRDENWQLTQKLTYANATATRTYPMRYYLNRLTGGRLG
ncbi:MAG: polysaccharide deacetylase family protein [Magnetococcales bacterium]|nr:polysaccharide deacetylase family protein [Magnetococcales bacterium]